MSRIAAKKSHSFSGTKNTIPATVVSSVSNALTGRIKACVAHCCKKCHWFSGKKSTIQATVVSSVSNALNVKNPFHRRPLDPLMRSLLVPGDPRKKREKAKKNYIKREKAKKKYTRGDSNSTPKLAGELYVINELPECRHR